MQQRILIVLEDGTLKGMSVTTDTGSPIPLDIDGLAELIPSINAASLAEIERLKTEHAAALAAALAAAQGQPAPFASSLLTELDTIFESLPAEVQLQFEDAWSTVRALYQAGKLVRAYNYISALPVPENLAATKAAILEKLEL
jgi:hypothetical protein